MNFKNQLSAFAVAAAAAIALSSTAHAQLPMQVQDVDNASRGAVSIEYKCPFASPGTYSSCTTKYAIPDGYRLTVTQVSSSAAANSRPTFVFHGLLGVKNDPVYHFAVAEYQVAGLWMHTAHAQFTVDKLISGTLHCTNCTLIGADVYVSGYLVKK